MITCEDRYCTFGIQIKVATTGYCVYGKLWEMSDNISKTVQNKDVVTMDQ